MKARWSLSDFFTFRNYHLFYGTYNITTTIQVWADYSGLEKGAYASIGDPDNLSSSNFSGTLTPSSPTSAPEPATMLLLGLGLMGLAGVRRKFNI